MICSVFAAGFASAMGERLRVSAPRTPAVEIVLDPLPLVRGRLFKPDGTLLANARLQVYLQAKNPTQSAWTGEALPALTTDANGEFGVPFRQPGEHTLTFIAPNVGAAGPEAIITETGTDLLGLELRLRPCGSVAGKVCWKRVGTPVPDFPVRLARDDGSGIGLSATTDAEGAFGIADVPPGAYTVSWNAEGFVQPPNDQRQVVRVGEGEHVDGVLVELTTLPVLVGRILRPDGTPLANRQQAALHLKVQTPEGLVSTSLSVNTSDDGEFASPLEPEKPRFGPARASVVIAKVGSGSRRFRLVEGEDPPVLEFQLHPLASVTGQVRERGTKRPLVDASVQLSSGTGETVHIPKAKTDADGRFAFADVPAGLYRLSAKTDADAGSAYREVSVAGGQELGNLVLEVPLPQPLVGQVFGKDGTTPLAGAEVWFGRDECTADDQGRFAFGNADRGSVVMVQAQGLAQVVQPVNRDAAQPGQPVEVKVVLRHAGGSLSGIVRRAGTNEPVEDAVVVAWDRNPYRRGCSPLNALRELSASGQAPGQGGGRLTGDLEDHFQTATDGEGRYRFEHLPENEYTILVAAPGLKVARREGVTVAEGADCRGVDLTLEKSVDQEPAPVTLSGRLVKTDGTALALTGFAWRLSTTPGSFPSSEGRTDADGRYVLSLGRRSVARPQGQEVALEVCVLGFRRTRTDGLLVPADGVLNEVDFRLEEQPAGSVSGTVFLPDGQSPAEAVRVVAFSQAHVRQRLERSRSFGSYGSHRSSYGRYGQQVGWSDQEATFSDERGHYRLTRLEPGTYTVEAHADRSGDSLAAFDERLHEAVPAIRDEVVLAAGEETTGQDLTLGKSGSISGTVVTTDGEPLSGVSVSASLAPSARASRALLFATGSNAHTDETGRFLLERVPPGTWNVGASLPGFSQRQAPTAVVKPGEETSGLSLRLRRHESKWASVSGRVLLPDGRAAEQARVGADSWLDGYGYRWAVTDPDGRFELSRIRPGRTSLRAWKAGYAWSEPIEVTLTPEATKEGVTLALRTGGSVEGRVVREEGATLAEDAFVWAIPAGDRLWLRHSDYGVPAMHRVALVDEQGRFGLTQVTPGENHLFLIDASGKLLDVKRNVAVTAGEDVRDVSLHLRSFAGSVTGTVTRKTDRSPVANASVYACNDLFGRYVFGAGTDEYGRFAIGGLPPGVYHVFCDLEGFALTLALASCAQRDVAVGPEQPTRVDFELVAGGAIAGKVLAADGKVPVEGAMVATVSPDTAALDPPQTGLTSRTATTDESGAFELKHLMPGEYEIHVIGPYGTGSVAQRVTVWDNQTATMEARLEQ
jgi:hypothetical protein